ncbi:MAG: hypothetical protein EOS14_18775 [Mesorhizobium sp.]|nr:MAG: hypothetical protein EOS14_18775 [Mesorhizobium sp.]
MSSDTVESFGTPAGPSVLPSLPNLDISPTWGGSAAVSPFANLQRRRNKRSAENCESPPSWPLVGEMSGRTEGGAKDLDRPALCRSW